MKIKIKGSILPTVDDAEYWNNISNLVSHNSLVGLNDIIPGLRSQKLRIPESVSRVTYNTFDKKVDILITSNKFYLIMS